MLKVAFSLISDINKTGCSSADSISISSTLSKIAILILKSGHEILQY